jgi:O-antigen/teichoic acid export membrane protein
VSGLATEQVLLPAVEVRPGWLRSHLSTPMYRNAYALLLNTGITSVLGLAYWAVAAHRYPAVDIGRASSAISALQLLSGIAQCNLNNSLPRLVPTAGAGTGRLVARSYGVAVGLSLILAAGFAALAGRYGWAGGFLSQGPGYVLWFVAAVGAWSVFFLEDAVFAGLRQAVWVPVENTSFSIGKIVLLVALAGVTVRFGVFGSFTIPVAIAVIPVNWVIFRRLIPRHRALAASRTTMVANRPVRSYLLGEYVGGLANLATTTMLPLLVASEIGSVANAYFYSAWIVGSSFEYLLSSIAVSLVVEGANNRDRAAWAARRGAMITAAVLLPAVALTLVAAPTVLQFVGSSYAASGTVVLRLVALAVLPRAVISLTVATARIRQDIRTMVLIQGTGCVLTLGLAVVLLPRLGLAGAGIAYAGGQAVVAMACLPGLVRTLRGGGPVAGRHSPGAAGGPGPLPTRGWRAQPTVVLAAAIALAVALLTGAGVSVPGEPVLAAAFLVWVPGAAAVGYLRLEDRLLAAALSVAASIAIGTLGAEAMLWTGTWHPRAGVVVLAALSALALLGQAERRRLPAHAPDPRREP